MSARHSFRRRLRYKFDTLLARGTVAVILWLGLITATVVTVTGVLLSVLDIAVHGHNVGIIEGVWQNMLRSFEPAAMEADTGWPLRLQSLFVVLFGILVGSSLIGLIASGIERRVDELRKGRSEVIEEGHTLILGWSEKVFPVIAELVLAHRGRRDSVIVVLADHDKIEMEDAIRARVHHMGHTRVVCRRGDPSNPADLALVSPYESRSVIVLGNNHMDGDAHVIRSVLALMDDEDRFPTLRVVADCALPENADALREASGGYAIAIASADLIARVTAQACRHTGLGTVFTEILDFGDVDIQFHADARLSGRTFGDLVMSYEQGAAIGVRYPDGVVDLNPPDDHLVAPEDTLVLVTDNLDDIDLRAEPERPTLPPPPSASKSAAMKSHILLVGWNQQAPRILNELDKWVEPGSTVRVLVDTSLVTAEEVTVPGLKRLEVLVTETFASAPRKVAELCLAEQYERVVVLCYRSGLSAEEADARSLMTLLQLRQFRHDHPELGDRMSVLTEVLDIRDVQLARVAGAEDFIVSERITALMLAQLAEVPEREKVFADLFETTGSEICMRPISDYADPQPGLPFGAYVAAAHKAGHLAIGYRSTGARGKDLASAINLDPPKSKPVNLKPDDRLIIVVSRESDPALDPVVAASARHYEGTTTG
jgi:voltage-gated potassium channel Kch